MAFSQATIEDVRVYRDSADLLITWSCSSTPPVNYQVYLNHELVWTGRGTRCRIPYPVSLSTIDVGTVGSGEEETDYSGSLASAPQSRIALSWRGGSYLDPAGLDDVQGFHVYGSTVAGGAVSYTTPLATIPAYPQGNILDGFGLGGFGHGGFGRAASYYEWTSDDTYTAGTWSFAVKSFDLAGNESSVASGSQAIAAPPRAPAASVGGSRLSYTYSIGTNKATLTWAASP